MGNMGEYEETPYEAHFSFFNMCVCCVCVCRGRRGERCVSYAI